MRKQFAKQLVAVIFCMVTALAARGADVLVTSAGGLEMERAQCLLVARLYTTDWQGRDAEGSAARDAEGAHPFRLEVPGGGQIAGTARFAQTGVGASHVGVSNIGASSIGASNGGVGNGGVSNVEASNGGAIVADYVFTPQADVVLNSLFVGAALPTSQWAGGTWECDGEKGELPREQGGLAVVSRTARSLTLVSANGRKRLAFVFPEPTDILVQDNRQWGPDFALRIGVLKPKTFRANEPVSVRFTLSAQEPLRLARDEPVTLQAGADWVPLKQEPEIVAGSALDFSRLRGTESPAGKYGRVVARGADFEFEKQPGVPQRFYGVNLCFTANFLEPADAQRLAQRLARTGYNALRLHHYDAGLTEGAADGTTLNAANLARFDALMAACIANGIYVTTDLFVSRCVPWRSVGIERDGNIAMDEYKVLVAVNEAAFENLKNFTRQLLTHVNPHTKRSYAQEPALAWLALINEGNFGNFLHLMRGIPEWQKAWAAWLAARQIKEPEAFKDIPATLPENYYADNRHTAAFTLFLKEMEDLLVTRFKTFLRGELGCDTLITNRSSWTNRPPDQVTRSELYDYVDDHFYVDHPQFIEQPWRLPSRCDNVNPLQNEAMGAQNVVFTRLLDKPFTITEYNYAGPGRFRGMGGIVTGALGALQGWSGLWRYTYSHSRDTVLGEAAMNYFDMAGDPLSLAAERACICLFLRGDLAPLQHTYALVLPKKDVLKMRNAIPLNKTAWPWLGWYARLGTVVADAAPKDAAWSGPYPEIYATKSEEIRSQIGNAAAGNGAVTIDPTDGTFILKTPRTAGGFTERGQLDAGDLVFNVGETAATVWVSALDEKPIRESAHLLLTHLTDVQNTRIRYAEQSRKTLLDWGTLPHLARNGKAEVQLTVGLGKWRVYALSTGGHRKTEIPARILNGRLTFTADINTTPGDATLMYEVVR